MSGFASELAVFVGVTTSDIYSTSFRTVMVALSAVGLILTPIYLLSMLRQIFYGRGTDPACVLSDVDLRQDFQDNQETVCFGTDCLLPTQARFDDARPREAFIAACFLVLIVGIGVYPKLPTQVYDAKTVALNTEVLQSYTQFAAANQPLFAKQPSFPQEIAPELALVQTAGVYK
jgi:NAD(P)H-quinone oxidoreductase subunit 4